MLKRRSEIDKVVPPLNLAGRRSRGGGGGGGDGVVIQEEGGSGSVAKLLSPHPSPLRLTPAHTRFA